MAIVIKPITVEVSKPNIFQAIAAKQYDSNSRFLKVTFVNEGEMIPVLPTSKVSINAKRPDGASDSFFGEVNDDGTATVPLHSWILELAGFVDCDVSIIDSEGRMLTCTKFSLLVEEAANDSEDVSDEEQQNVLSELLKAIETLTPKYSKEDIDPTFANNSWEVIKWVCQYDDPSKYWKVGDYKMLPMGEKLAVTNLNPDPDGWYGGGGYIGGKHHGTVAYFSDLECFLSTIQKKPGTYTLKCPQWNFAPPYSLYDEMGTKIYEGVLDELGISLSDMTEGPDEWEFVVDMDNIEYPLQIIGFNHDKVANPYEYGKQKAGMTLQFGASRHILGDLIPTLYSPILEGVMADDGIHYKSPCRTVYDGDSGEYVDRRTNWKDGAFRTSLDTILFSSPLDKLVVSVQKYTSQYYKSSNHYSAAMLTEDRVFLPSEYEVFGEVVNAPCQEGEQYEFYKDGYSKFMWSEELLSGAVPNGRLWLRSAKGADVNESTPDSVSACSVYMSVTSLPNAKGEGAKVNYQPASAASNSSAAYIAPCICL